MNRIVALLAALLTSVLAGCAWLDTQQRQLALRPTPGRPAAYAEGSAALLAAFKPGDERWLVEVRGESDAMQASQQLALWWLPQTDPKAPVLLYLHGTFRNLYQNLPKINALREAGFAIVAVDYRGWGDSTFIVPSEQSIAADAQAAWAEVQRRQPMPGRRVIFGHSMGGAVAVRLASGLVGAAGADASRDYGALILESTFTRLPDVARKAGFWGGVAASLTSLDFDSVSRIARIDAPIVMMHGTADKTVPFELGLRLRDAAPSGTQWVPVPGGTHSQLHAEAAALYQQTMRAVVSRLAAPPSVR
jgi:uncharacterized protein